MSHSVSLSCGWPAVGNGFAGQTGQRSERGLTPVEVALVSRPTHAKVMATFPGRLRGLFGNVSTTCSRSTVLTEPNIRKSHWPREPTRKLNGFHGYRQPISRIRAPVLESGRTRHATSPATIHDTGMNVPITSCRVLDTRGRSMVYSPIHRPAIVATATASPTHHHRSDACRLIRAPASVPRPTDRPCARTRTPQRHSAARPIPRPGGSR